jgi:UDP-glucose 4-epimerase
MCCDAGVKKIIYPSTGGAIYGRCSDKPFKEDDAVNPISPYAINKLALEGYLKYFRNSRGLDYVIYRISNPYGPLQNVTGAQGIIPIYLNKIKNNLPLDVFGDGSMRRDYIYIKDTIDMICKSFEKTSQDIYNLGSGSSNTINDIIYEISKVTKQSVQINYMPERATDIKNVELDMSRFYNEYNMRANTSLSEGIFHTWQYVKNISL